MPFAPPDPAPRCGVVDLGSNSVRLVVYEGHSRSPMPIFNEKAVLRLGRGLESTGHLNEEGVGQALTVMQRYHAVARAMGAQPFEVLATAAVRDADNGPAFVEALRRQMPGVPIHVLSGTRKRLTQPTACCAASQPRTAYSPISAVARSRSSGWSMAQGDLRKP